MTNFKIMEIIRVCYVFIAISLICESSVKVAGCPDNCVSCMDSNQCQRCGGGYFLQINRCQPCPNGCATCTNATYCTICKKNYWSIDKNCNSKCLGDCDESGCDDKTGFCNGCPSGFYGKYCEQKCTYCKNNLCELHQCKNGCDDGFYDLISDGYKLCKMCRNKCVRCDDPSICLECEKGFFKYNNSKRDIVQCLSCPPNCEECNNYTDCTVCIPGKYGSQCENNCTLPNCHRCSKYDDVEICTECNSGYELEDDYCVLCENKDRVCLSGCLDGYWGIHCNETCYEGCASNQCKQTNGSCDSCHRKNYGDACQFMCSDYCVNDSSLLHICTKSEGICKGGCKAVYSGVRCNIAPTSKVATSLSATAESTTVNTDNDKLTNSKTSSVKTGSTTVKRSNEETTKPISTVKTESTTVKRSDEKTTKQTSLTGTVLTTTEMNYGIKDKTGADQSIALFIGTGTGGGVFIIILVIVMIFCILRKRKRTKYGAPTNNFDNGQDMHEGMQNDSEVVYARPYKPSAREDQDYIYAKPNKPKKSINHNKIDTSGPQTTYGDIAIDIVGERRGDIYESEVVEETDIDDILLENVDDEPNSALMTEMNIPDSDTYYNVIGLRRSRIQIPKLFEYIKNKTDFENEFEKLPQGLTRTCNEALTPQNVAKNRFNGIYAYDATRVKLRSKNFINANYIDGQGQSHISYIASIGPTKSTMNNFATFWEMVWQENSNKIVMLTNLEESEKMKCEQYWPARGSHNIYGDFTVTSIAEKVFSDFVVREFTVDQNSETRKVTQYHYTAWPDKTVPDTVASLVEFRDKIEQEHTPVTDPIIVHCSAGIGRTGTYIALDILIREGKEETCVDIFGCVIALRGQRVNLVQNVEQYIFPHHCVLYALTCDPDTLPVTAIPHFFTDEKIVTQYQSYQNLKLLTSKDKRLTFKAKSRKENRKGADIPADEHRVRLTLTKHDYINAVYVNGYKETNKFILAQTPLPNTVEDFLSMLYQERCSCIICLDDGAITDKTVSQYVPQTNNVSTFGHFQVSCTERNQSEDFIFRELKVSRIGTPSAKDLTIRHYQFKGWNISDTVPKTVSSFLNMIFHVEKARKSSNSEQPIVVHCLTGSARSGLFCVVSVLLEKVATEKELSVLNTICQVRSRRRSAIQDIEELRFCYNCVEEMLEMSGTNTYYNISSV